MKRADRLVPAGAAPGRQRSVHRHRLPAEPHPEDGAEPELPRARARATTRSSSSGTATRTPPSGRLQLGEVDMVPEVSAAGFARLGDAAEHRDARRPPRRRTRSWRSTCARRRSARTPTSTPRSRTAPSARRSPTRSTASGSTRSPPAGTSFPAPRDPAVLLQVVLRGSPPQDYPYDPDKAKQILDDAGWAGQRRRPADQGRRGALVQPLRALGVAVQHPGGEADRRGGQGRRHRLQRPGRQHRQALRPDGAQGRRQAGARLRHVHLGLGRRPVRPELPAQHPDDRARSAAPPTRTTRTPSTTGSSSSRPASSTPPSARRSSSGWSRSPSATCPTWS